MPGLIRGVARTAVIAGTATTVSNRVSRRQANKGPTRTSSSTSSSSRRSSTAAGAAPPRWTRWSG